MPGCWRRSHVAPPISKFVREHPQVEVQLQLSVNPPPLAEDSFDLCIRFGAPPDTRVIARRIASRNGRLVQVLPQHTTPDAHIYAVYPGRHRLATRVRAFVAFLAMAFERREASGPK